MALDSLKFGGVALEIRLQPAEILHFLYDLSDPVFGIGVTAQKLRGAAFAFSFDFLEELGHSARIQTIVEEDLSPDQIRLSLGIARVFQEKRTRRKLSAKLRHHGADRVTAEDTPQYRERNLGGVGFGSL